MERIIGGKEMKKCETCGWRSRYDLQHSTYHNVWEALGILSDVVNFKKTDLPYKKKQIGEVIKILNKEIGGKEMKESERLRFMKEVELWKNETRQQATKYYNLKYTTDKEIERLKTEKADLQVKVRRWKKQYETIKFEYHKLQMEGSK